MNVFIFRRTLVLATGGVIGGLLGYYLTSLILDRIIEKDESEETENPYDTVERVMKETPLEEKTEDEERKVNYNEFSKKGNLKDLVAPYTSFANPIVYAVPDRYDHIKIISLEEFTNNRGFNKSEVTYYDGDLTFADSQEKIIPDPVTLFGPNIHLHFGEESQDPDIVYVRNERSGTDYELICVHNKYSVLIMGMPDEPKEPKVKRRRNPRKVSTKNGDQDEEDPEGE